MKKLILLLAILAFGPIAQAQAPYVLMPMPRDCFNDATGKPLAGGQLWSYQAGTTTPLATYSDNSGSFQNTNPVFLDSAGCATVWIGSTSYKFVMNNVFGQQQWMTDNVSDIGQLIKNGGYVDLSSNQTIGGNKNFTGSILSPLIENVQIVDETLKRGGNDIGAEINLAYTATAISGGLIFVAPKSDGSCYSYSTPISFPINGKLVTLSGVTGATCIQYIPTSGNAITIDYGQGGSNGPGIRDMILLGPCITSACTGVTANGLVLGPTNGAVGAYFVNFHIGNYGAGGGFLNNIVLGQLAYIAQFINTTILNGNVGILQAAGQINENVHFTGGCLCNNATGASFQGIGGDFFISNMSIDDNTAIGVSQTGTVNTTWTNDHFENVGLGTAQYITATAGNVNIIGGQMGDDRQLGTNSQLISFSGGKFTDFGTNIGSNGITITQALNLTGGSAETHFVFGDPSSRVINNFNPTTTNRIEDYSLRDDVLYPALTFNFFNLFSNGGYGWTEVTQPSGFAGKDFCYGDSTTHTLECSYNNSGFFPQTQTLGSGVSTSNGTPIAAGTSQAQPAITISGADPTKDVAACSLNAAPPATWQTGIQLLAPIVTTNTVTPWLSNPTAGSITPVATAIRCSVKR